MNTIKPATIHFWHELSPLARGLFVVSLLLLLTVFVVHFSYVYQESVERQNYREIIRESQKKLNLICARAEDLCKE